MNESLGSGAGPGPERGEESRRSPRLSTYEYAGVGLQFAATFGVFGLCGWWLDGRLGTAPWLMVTGIFVGAAGAFYSLVRRLSPDRRGSRTRTGGD